MSDTGSQPEMDPTPLDAPSTLPSQPESVIHNPYDFGVQTPRPHHDIPIETPDTLDTPVTPDFSRFEQPAPPAPPPGYIPNQGTLSRPPAEPHMPPAPAAWTQQPQQQPPQPPQYAPQPPTQYAPQQPSFPPTLTQPTYPQQPSNANSAPAPQAPNPPVPPMPTPASPKRRMSPAMLGVGAFGLVGLLAGVVGISYGLGQKSKTDVITATTTALETSDSAPDSLVTASETTNGSVGNVGKDVAGGSFTIDRIKSSMIRIETKGSYRPFGGETTAGAGSGSGFIMSADGLAVTNNHVVAGAAIVEVFIGDEPKARPARVLGRSECSDLALIDIDGAGFKPLQWSGAPMTAGVDVYAAGFPLGDTEPTLTRGIVSKARADGDTPWASIDHVVEHDANIQPGNSGGPLVTSDGNVLAINYAGADRGNTGTTQFFAIANDIARPVVDRLRNGDFETLGVNGQAFRDEEAKISGVWVAGVADGSPASKLGLLPGDVITTLKGFPVGLDGTMRDYCKVVRSAADTDVIGVEVYRPDAKKSFAGEFRGEPLRESFSFASPEVGAVQPSNDNAAPPSESDLNFANVTDDTGRISADLPTTWTGVDGGGFDAGGDVGVVPALIASTDLKVFKESNDVMVPGVMIAAVDLAQFGVPPNTPIPDSMYEDLLDSFGNDVKSQCTIGERSPFDRNGVSGRFQLLTDCGKEKASAFVVVAAPPDGRFITIILSVALSEADVFALDRVVSTFRIR